MNHLKKVLVWRAISVVITLVITWGWSGSIASATGLTITLHTVMLLVHWVFEDWWLKISVNKILAPSKKRPDGRLDWSDDEKEWRPGKW